MKFSDSTKPLLNTLALTTVLVSTVFANPVPRYRIEEIPTLGGTASTAYGLNEQGIVVGSARDGGGVERPIRFSGGTITVLPDLGFGGIAYAINTSGHATGAVATGTSYSRPWDGNTSVIDHVALWNHSGLVDLGNLGGLPRGEGRRISDDGWIVGTASAPLPAVQGEDIWQRAFIKTGNESEIRDAGAFPGDIRSFIFDLNDARKAPGFSVSDNRGGPAQTAAGVWEFDANGQVLAITPLQPYAVGMTGVALGINNAGDVVGRSATSTNQQVTVIWRAGHTTPELLPVLQNDPGSFVRAWQINNSGLVVGELRSGSNANDRYATLWQDSGNGYERLDLQELIPADAGWDLQGAFAINNAGQIVGYGLRNGQQRGFIAHPLTKLGPGGVNLNLVYQNGELDLQVHENQGTANYRPEDLILAVGTTAEQPIPDTVSSSFLGKPGRSAWILSNNGSSEALSLSLSGQGLASGVFVDQTLRLELISATGAGSFFLYSEGSLGNSQIYFNSSDGVDASDFLPLAVGSSPALQWAFNAPGCYRIGLRATGTLIAGNAPVASEVFYLTFDVPLAELPQPLEEDDRKIYKVNLIEVLGANYIAGEEINEAGSVAVAAYDENDLPSAGRFTNELEILAPLTPGGAYANSINNAGLIVGWSLDGSGLRRAVAWANASPTDLGTLGGDRGEARGVNDAGQVVGQARNSDGNARAFVWTETSGMSELPMTLGGDRSSANAINQSGQAAGSGRLPNGNNHAVRYDPTTNITLDLGTLGGEESFANGINDSGHVAGLSDDDDNGFRPFFWSPESGMVDLFAESDLGSPFGSAYDINNSGQVVGYGEINDDFDSHAFLWTQADGLRDLNDLVLPLPGLALFGASGINHAGMIAGWGELNGAKVAYRLTPATRLKRGDVGLGIDWEDGRLGLHARDFTTGFRYSEDAFVLHAPVLAQTTVPQNPAFQFLGTSGAPVWILPQTQNPKLLFLGIGADEVNAGVFVNDELELRLLAVEGPGSFSVYSVDGNGAPQIRFNSGDGISTSDQLLLTAGVTSRVNWAFTAPGVYRVKFRAAGILVADNAAVESDEIEVCFEVVEIKMQLSIAAEGNSVKLSLPTQLDLIYQLESSSDLQNPWTNEGEAFIGTGRVKEIIVPQGPEKKFFRVRGGTGH